MSQAEKFRVLCPQCGDGEEVVFTTKTRKKQAARAAMRHNEIRGHECYVEGFE